MAKQKSEKQLAKELMPSYHKKAQEQALTEVKKLLKQIKIEPFPDDFAVSKEDKEMKQRERGLAKMLSPLDKIEGEPIGVVRPATVKKSRKQIKKKKIIKKRKK